MNRIREIRAWEALDSRGTPTVAVRLTLDGGASEVAIVPSGASAGSHEALELRDGGARHDGRGVRRAVAHVHDVIAPRLLGRDGCDPSGLDAELARIDPTPNFGAVGANAVLGVSLAAWQVAAAAQGVSLARLLHPEGALELPMPMINVISGGAHAGGLIDVQDFLVVPNGAADIRTAIEWAVEVRQSARAIAAEWGYPAAMLVADEGGLGLPLPGNRVALDLLTAAIERAGLRPGDDASIAIDVAATQLVSGEGYQLASEDRVLDAEALIAELAEWTASYPVVSIEDPLGEDDWRGWRTATEHLGSIVELVGDDLFVTQSDRVQRGIDESVANSVLVKVNQNGTVSGAATVVELARAAGYSTVVSARSGDTEQSWLADLAVGWRAGQIKVGSTHRSERTAKWNRLLELEATEQTVFHGPWAGTPASPLRTASIHTGETA
jgi:enolase